jgi:L-ascorbate metabolism protein UlaG (beta-lactamase superfamily)
MEVTYFGHSCFLLNLGGKQLLFDPYITPNEQAKNINIEEIKPDFILLSHGHGDHVADVEKIYKNNKPQLISTFEVINWFEKKGIEGGHPMNHGGSWDFSFGSVKMVNAIHSSSMPDGSYGGNPAGFIIRAQDITLYYAGDTALHYDMQLIAEEFNIDLAFLPIGSNFTMDIDDALRAADFVKTKKIIGMHYDTFPYIKIDHQQTMEAAKEAKIDLNLLNIGETRTF